MPWEGVATRDGTTPDTDEASALSTGGWEGK